MQRKLVQMGQHTLMAAIPSKWVQRHNLKKGDFIEFNEVENKLVATSTAEIFERKTEVTVLSPTIEVIWRIIQPAYTSGYDELIIHYHDKRALPLIERSIKDLIGFEIVEVTPTLVKVKSISKQLDEEFPVILRRTFLVLQQMTEVMAEILGKKQRTRLEEIKSLEITINRYTMFLKRIINRTGYKYPHYTYLLVTFLELAANHIEYLRRYLASSKRGIEPEILKEWKKLVDLNRQVYDLYYNYSAEKFVWIAEAQPHFKWFEKIKDPTIKFNFKAMAEYLVQMARQIVALYT